MQLSILVSGVKKDYDIFAQTRNAILTFTLLLLKELFSAGKAKELFVQWKHMIYTVKLQKVPKITVHVIHTAHVRYFKGFYSYSSSLCKEHKLFFLKFFPLIISPLNLTCIFQT